MPSATKGLRLGLKLRADFEKICRQHLLDERAVVEAWLLAFNEASDAERTAVAERYGEWLAAQPTENKSRPRGRPKKTR